MNLGKTALPSLLLLKGGSALTRQVRWGAFPGRSTEHPHSLAGQGIGYHRQFPYRADGTFQKPLEPH